MKPGALLINVARARIVDEDALYAALKDGHLGGAALKFGFTCAPAKMVAIRFCREIGGDYAPAAIGGRAARTRTMRRDQHIGQFMERAARRPPLGLGLGRDPAGLTMIFPTMYGWIVQIYGYSPGAAKVWEKLAGIATRLGNHSFRATGITAYLKNGGTLEKAAAMANHASTRTTQLYDRRRDELSLDEVERIVGILKRPIARIRPAENRHLNAAVIVFPFDAPVAGVDAVFEYLGWFRHAGSGSTLTVNTGIVLGDPMPERVKLLPEPGELGA